MTLPSDIIQAAPLHITFNSGYVPPGFFTRFVVVLTNKMELCFEKDIGIYRNRVTFRYQDPNSTTIEHVIVTDCTDVIQIDVQHHHLNQEVVSFTKICQNIRVLLEDAAKEVEEILKKCASGQTDDNKSTSYIFMHKFKYVCASCCQSTPSHYIKLSPANQTLVCCENNTTKYRLPTELEEVWFKDTNQATEKPSSSQRIRSPKPSEVMSTPAEPGSLSMPPPTDTHIHENPPVDPTHVFQSHIAKLCKTISSDVVAVCNECYSSDLIGDGTYSYVITATGVSIDDKATRLIHDIESQLKSSINKQEYLSNVIEAFLRVNNSNLSIVAEELKNSFL
uniref:Uncharacterized protein n=1 Tax=Amphimedon queenslandica TaxID=400682 RepID=A0A1X7TF96_AMPQE